MKRIKVEKNPSPERLKELNVESWSPWSCGVSTFDWEYSEDEICYIQEGKAIVETEEGTTEITKGELVFFPRGLKCRWQILEPIKKVYRLG